jgi:hypothetical protein
MALHVVRKGAGNGTVQEEVWAPEELVAESAFKDRLDNALPQTEIPIAAKETARKLNARIATLIALRKSAFGIGFGRPSFHTFTGGPPRQNNGTNFAQLPGPPPDFQQAATQERNAMFERLTPEQRVQRARELLESKEN